MSPIQLRTQFYINIQQKKKIKRSWTQILQKAATRSSLALRTITVAKQQKHNKFLFFYSSVHSTEDAHQ